MQIQALCKRAHDLARPFLQSSRAAQTLPAYTPASPQAAAFHTSSAKIRALFGGDRSGKSEAGGYELVKLARLFPKSTLWACAMTYSKLKINAEKILKYLAPDEIAEIAWANRAMRIPALIRHINESVIEFKTYNSGIGVFASDSCKGIWLDEDPQRAIPNGEEIFVECLQRTIDCHGFVWLTATPVLGRNWMYKRVFLQAGISEDIAAWTVSLFDNATITREEKERAASLLTQDEIQRRIYGEFTVLEGRIFKELSPERHFQAAFPIPSSWRIVRSIDLGYVNPLCCLWGAFDGDRLYVFLEHYQAQTLLQEHAAMITQMESEASLYAGAFYGIEQSVCDHERQTRAELETHGIFTTPAEKDWSLSIELINRLLKSGNIVIFKDRCPHLCEELQLYRYARTQDGKESPVKENDHSVDAFRYLVMYFFAGAMERGAIESVLPSEIA